MMGRNRVSTRSGMTIADKVAKFCRHCMRNNEVESTAWPWCWKCQHTVRAYGIVEQTLKHGPVVRVWSRCHGTMAEQRVRKPGRENVMEAPGNWVQHAIRMMVFFAE